MRQAQKLMEKHGISKEDVSISDVGTATAKAGAGKRPPTHIVMMADMVAGAFGAGVTYCSLHDGHKWTGVVEFYGVGSVAEVAGYAFEVLGRQLKRDRSNYLASLNKRLKRGTKVRRCDLYAQAWIYEVSKQVTMHKRSDAESSIIEMYKAKRWNTPLKTVQDRDNTKRANVRDQDAFLKGLQDGKKVSFHQGVKSEARTGIGREQLALA